MLQLILLQILDPKKGLPRKDNLTTSRSKLHLAKHYSLFFNPFIFISHSLSSFFPLLKHHSSTTFFPIFPLLKHHSSTTFFPIFPLLKHHSSTTFFLISPTVETPFLQQYVPLLKHHSPTNIFPFFSCC
jgi:hypothetical protein